MSSSSSSGKLDQHDGWEGEEDDEDEVADSDDEEDGKDCDERDVSLLAVEADCVASTVRACFVCWSAVEREVDLRLFFLLGMTSECDEWECTTQR